MIIRHSSVHPNPIQHDKRRVHATHTQTHTHGCSRYWGRRDTNIISATSPNAVDTLHAILRSLHPIRWYHLLLQYTNTAVNCLVSDAAINIDLQFWTGAEWAG